MLTDANRASEKLAAWRRSHTSKADRQRAEAAPRAKQPRARSPRARRQSQFYKPSPPRSQRAHATRTPKKAAGGCGKKRDRVSWRGDYADASSPGKAAKAQRPKNDKVTSSAICEAILDTCRAQEPALAHVLQPLVGVVPVDTFKIVLERLRACCRQQTAKPSEAVVHQDQAHEAQRLRAELHEEQGRRRHAKKEVAKLKERVKAQEAKFFDITMQLAHAAGQPRK